MLAVAASAALQLLQLAMPQNRLLKEYKEIMSGKPDDEIALALVDESDIFGWTARLKGPADSPYAAGTFTLAIRCAPNYPLAPPSVTFVTPIFHPNVLFKTGEICLDILKADSWTPAWTLQSVCRAVVALLSHPEADSPLNCDCGARPTTPAQSHTDSPHAAPALGDRRTWTQPALPHRGSEPL